MSARRRRSIGVALAALIAVAASPTGWPASKGYAAENLECPEIGPRQVAELVGVAAGGGLFVSKSRIDLGNEINESIYKLQISDPNVSWAEVQNVMIAAYCRVVADTTGLSASEKWSSMRQFESVLEHQIAANTMPPGTLIIANVPLPPDVFRELRSQAAASHLTTAELMAAILKLAAGR